MTILGITAPISWNSAAAIIKDKKLLAAVEEERFNGLKHSPRIIPIKSIEYCLSVANVLPVEVDAIAIGYRHPLGYYGRSFFENIIDGNLKRAFREFGAFSEYYTGLIRLYDWLKSKGFRMEGQNRIKISFVPHHLAHAASAFRCSGFDKANVITIDGQGEDDSGSLWVANNKKLKKIDKIGINQSLGMVYGETTDILGFKPHSHEGKVMGLAGWGKKTLNTSPYWKVTKNGYELLPDWQNKFWGNFGPRRPRSESLNDHHKNVALTVQRFTEKAGQSLARNLYSRNAIGNYCLAGGVALNCDMNAKIKELSFVDNIYIQPAANDAGTAIGAALELANTLGENSDFHMDHAYWGPEYSNDEIETTLKEAKISYEKSKKITSHIAKILSEGKIVGWFQGRLEIGPRALGNRSILAHPGQKGMKDKINREVKHRESWRPFAPSVLNEHGHEYFDNYFTHPFMNLAFNVNQKGMKDISQAVHVDKTARIQSVTQKANPKYHQLISEFSKITNIPALLNTSFNDAEQPLVNTPKEAIKTFFGTGLDILAIGDFIIEK